jgi:hypothetical protein
VDLPIRLKDRSEIGHIEVLGEHAQEELDRIGLTGND